MPTRGGGTQIDRELSRSFASPYAAAGGERNYRSPKEAKWPTGGAPDGRRAAGPDQAPHEDVLFRGVGLQPKLQRFDGGILAHDALACLDFGSRLEAKALGVANPAQRCGIQGPMGEAGRHLPISSRAGAFETAYPPPQCGAARQRQPSPLPFAPTATGADSRFPRASIRQSECSSAIVNRLEPFSRLRHPRAHVSERRFSQRSRAAGQPEARSVADEPAAQPPHATRLELLVRDARRLDALPARAVLV